MNTGTSNSAWVVGWTIVRRPFSSTRVLPEPMFRRLIELTSPRAELLELGMKLELKLTFPACGMVRKSSSPDTAAVAWICSALTTDTGSAELTLAPWIWEPTTTTSSTSAVSPAPASSAPGPA